ncbi:MAG: arginase [Polyangiaceae bacterium]
MNRRTVQIVGVPLDHGAGRRGVGMGPSALRIAGLHAALEQADYTVVDRGDLAIPAPETQAPGGTEAKFLPLISETCARLAKEVRDIVDTGDFPLVLGGDHSIAIGTLSGLAAHLKDTADDGKEPRIGVVWFDAHGDINTPQTSPSGNVHGMPVACLLGDGPAELTNIEFAGAKLDAAYFCQVGLRDIDEQEKKLLRASNIHCYTMAEIDRRTMSGVMTEVIELTQDVDWLHISFDIDSVDPRIAPGTGTPKLGGLTYREAHLAMEMLAATGRVASLELVEVNPTLDNRNSTAELAVGLIASALGQRIL